MEGYWPDQYETLLDDAEDWLRRQLSDLRGRIDLGGDSYIAFGEPAIPTSLVMGGLVLLVLVLATRS